MVVFHASPGRGIRRRITDRPTFLNWANDPGSATRRAPQRPATAGPEAAPAGRTVLSAQTSLINLLRGKNVWVSQEHSFARLGNTQAEHACMRRTQHQHRLRIAGALEMVVTEIARLASGRGECVTKLAVRSKHHHPTGG